MSWNTLSNHAFITADIIVPKAAEWVWFPYVPKGKITIIQGDPGEGKTTLSLFLAAQLSLPAEDRAIATEIKEPFKILYLTAEDGFDDTIMPRYFNAGGDFKNLFTIIPDEHSEALTFTDDRIIEWLEAFKDDPKLIIFDPIQAFLGDVDMHRANEVRPVMARIGNMSAAYQTPIVLIGHQNKQQGSKAIYRGLGSIDIAAAARSVLEVYRSGSDKNVRIVKHVKSSLAEQANPIQFEFAKDGSIRLSETISATEEKHRQTMQDKAIQFLYAALVDENKQPVERKSKSLEDVASLEGISPDTLRKARQKLNCKSYKKGNEWFTALSYFPTFQLEGGETECHISDATQSSTDIQSETIPIS